MLLDELGAVGTTMAVKYAEKPDHLQHDNEFGASGGGQPHVPAIAQRKRARLASLGLAPPLCVVKVLHVGSLSPHERIAEPRLAVLAAIVQKWARVRLGMGTS